MSESPRNTLVASMEEARALASGMIDADSELAIRPFLDKAFLQFAPAPPFPFAMGMAATSENVLWFEVDGKRVGEWDFRTTPPTFRGDVDASARSFCEAVLTMLPNLSVARHSESRHAPEPAATAFDSPATDLSQGGGGDCLTFSEGAERDRDLNLNARILAAHQP